MAVAVSVPKVAWQPSETWRVVLPLTGVHLAMFGYDLAHPDRFLNADRAAGRLEVILGLPAAALKGETLSYIAAHGIAGDWLPQGLVYLLGGQYLLIALQVALALISVVWVRDIGRRVGLSEPSAASAALLYGLLPHTLAFPHQLASEALFVPLVVLAFRASGLRTGAAIGLATLLRPVTILWPLAHAAVARLAPRQRALLLAAAFAPLAAWMAFELAQTGEFTLGRSDHDLGTNLYERVERVAALLPENQRPVERPSGQRRLSLGEYMAFVAAHPLLTALHSGRDVVVLAAKSGIERLTLDYFYLFRQMRVQVKDPDSGWRATAERVGFFGVLREFLTREPLLVFTSAAGALLFALFMALAAAGAARWLRNLADVPAELRAQRVLVMAFVLYIFMTAQVVDAAQSRHRAPAEFALCLLALAGWAAVRRRRHGS